MRLWTHNVSCLGFIIRRSCNIVCVRSLRNQASIRRHTLYDVLNVSPSATQAEIKSAYYELSLKYHPDRNSDEAAQMLFTEIARAYSVLGSLNSRREYDKTIGTYYTMRSSPKKGSGEKVLRLTDEMLEIDMKGIKESGVFVSTIATLSTVMSIPVRLLNVSVSCGGIHSHDMRVLQLLRQICNGTLAANAGLSTVTYIPGDLLSGNFSAEAGRLGQLSLLLAAALPCLPFTPIPKYTKCNRLQLKGSTHSRKEIIHADYIQTVSKPFINNFGFDFACDIRKRSFYPYCEGKVCLESLPVTDLKPINLTECGTLTRITIWSFVGGAKPMRVAQLMAKHAHLNLKQQLPGIPVELNTRRELNSRSEGTGQGLILFGEMSSGLILTGTALWKKDMTPEEVASEAVRMLVYSVSSGSCIDQLLQEQAMLFMALANGKSTLRVSPLTRRAKAVIKAIEVFTQVKFKVSSPTVSQVSKLKTVLVQCEGEGLVNENLVTDEDEEEEEEEDDGMEIEDAA